MIHTSGKEFSESIHNNNTSFWSRHKAKLISLASLLAIGSIVTLQNAYDNSIMSGDVDSSLLSFSSEPSCPSVERLSPSFNVSIDTILRDSEYKKKSIGRLSKAVQIPTEIQDVNPEPSEDPEFYKHFSEFHDYLQDTFPLVHKYMKREKINQFGLLYTWEGSNENLKPILLMGHQDVVPVNRDTWNDWNFPPFSGHYEEETDLLWGRGSNDCKNLVLAEFEALEKLIEDGFQPERTVLLSLGFDEESSGTHGAAKLAPVIHNRYGDNGVLIIIDEGEGIIKVDDDVFVAEIINGEKGYVDVVVNVVGHGGHSSVPPDHTTIGIASELVTLFESNPWGYDFAVDNPLYGTLTCTAEHSKSMSDSLRDIILNAKHDEKKRKLLTDFVSSQKNMRDLIRTTQSVDIIRGGVKANALPESTNFLVNHRVDLHSSVNDTVMRDLYYVKQVAEKHNYGVLYNDEYLIEPTELGYIELTFQKELEPAPVSASSGELWDVLSGTIQDVFENVFHEDNTNKELYVTTGVFSGNTDTKHYWNVSDNIYRFVGSLFDESSLKTVHSVNENIEMNSHLSAIAFIYEFVVNVNESGKEL